MTLLGNIHAELPEIEQKLTKLANSLSPLDLTLGPMSFSTTYFQSVFVRVDSTAKLLGLNIEAKKLFSMENVVFMPHISLLYGEHNMAIREEVAAKVELSRTNFSFNELTITPATSKPNEWEHMSRIEFKGK